MGSAVAQDFRTVRPLRNDNQAVPQHQDHLHAIGIDRQQAHPAPQHDEARSLDDMHAHVERLNGTQRLMLKRLNRLTYCFSKKFRYLEAAFATFAAAYNFSWRTRKRGKSGKLRPTAAMMARLTDRTWSFDELFKAVLE